MARYDYRDIALELVELCRELRSDILQQLTYYRASVYKTETSKILERKVEQMRLLSELLGDELLCDAFRDYDVMKLNAHQWVTPGECHVSFRLTNLFQTTDKIFEKMAQNLYQIPNPDPQIFNRHLNRHRRDILTMCQYGSRQWSFFNSL